MTTSDTEKSSRVKTDSFGGHDDKQTNPVDKQSVNTLAPERSEVDLVIRNDKHNQWNIYSYFIHLSDNTSSVVMTMNFTINNSM